MAKKTFVIDTSVFLTNADSIYSFENNDIVIPLKVLEEIDNHKKRQDGVGASARKIIRILDSLREKGSLIKGVRLAKGKGLVMVRAMPECLSDFPIELNISIPDNAIIATAWAEISKVPGRKVFVVSRDINMRVICDSLGIAAEDYLNSKVVKDTESIYSGFKEYLVDDQIIDSFYEGNNVFVNKKIEFYPNQYVMLVSSSNANKTALARFINFDLPLKKIPNFKSGVWGIHPKNREQAFSLDMLMDPSISLVTLIGKAGSGKTICAIATGVEQVLEGDTYSRLIVSRPVQPLGRDIGYLPGSMEEKMMPWLSPIQDNLKTLVNDKVSLELYMEKGIIEIEALTYIRGRSISNAFIIIDEAQNLSIHEIKTIITRVGEGTKIVLTGDVEQIDNAYIDETSNGLVHAIEKFKDCAEASHITMRKGERSRIATLAAEIL